jgi:hypothetical protein
MTKQAVNNYVLSAACIFITIVLYISCYSISFFEKTDEESVVIDEKTGLIWQANRSNLLTWEQAVEYCTRLELDGSNDWRLPSIDELESAIRIKSRFPKAVKDYLYWSSTLYEQEYYAWIIDFNFNWIVHHSRKSQLFVMCVRNSKSWKSICDIFITNIINGRFEW